MKALHPYVRHIKKIFLFLPLFTFLFFNFTHEVKAQTLPAQFSQVQVVAGISNPTVMAFAPDGRIFIAQQTGQLRIVKNGALLTQPFVTLSVNSSGERGLLGIAFDPNFATNNFIYLYYTVSSGANNRISRFTANGDIAVAGSEVQILNLDPLSGATNHNGGTMQFGPDGKLYVGVGENANPANAQNQNTYHGKLLRINSDGSVPAGNPFTTGTSQRLRIWAYGLRNPYTITFQPGTGKLFVNDVGQNAWEEINDATTGGRNFGWPDAEGNSSNGAFTNPVYFYGHGTGPGIGCAITGGTFFNPVTTNYPSRYIGKYFFIDFCSNWIDTLRINGSTGTASNFASNVAGSPVSIITGNDGNLYFLSRSNSALYKITYAASTAPVITNQPQSQTVAQGNPVTFSVSATGSAPLSYQWRKNGVNISGATSSTYTITNVNSSHAGMYSVVVTNGSGSATSNNATLTVTTPNQPPNATILSPVAGATYAGGTTVSYSGSATDPESGSLPASAFTWYVLFYHDIHNHPGPTAPSGVTSGTFSIPNSGETATNVFYRLFLVVTDPQGARDTAFTDILPRTSVITLNSNPQGLTVTLDGQPFVTPYTVASVEGILRTIGTASLQTLNGLSYTFSNWSHGGAQTQSFATPVNDVSYTANFTTPLRNPENPANTTGGLNYAYYTGVWDVIPNFPSLTPAATGNVLNFDISPRTTDEGFGFRFTGYVSVPTDGVYTFYTSSDDGSKLYIGTTPVVNNDGLHANQEQQGPIGLKAGKHAVMVDFFEKSGDQVLSVSYAGPGIAKQLIPNASLFRVISSPPVVTILNPVADAHVRSGSFANTNYGSNTKLNTKNSTAANGTYQTFVRFNISSVSTNLSSVKLRLYGRLNNSNVSSVSIQVFNVTSNTWQENTITFTNKPAFQATVLASSTVTGTTNQYYEWDLTQHIINLRTAGATSVSLLVKNLTVSNNTLTTFNSKESATNKPELRISTNSARNAEKINVSPGSPATVPLYSFSIFPNPASNSFTLTYPTQFMNSKIQVIDIAGRLVKVLLLTNPSAQTIMVNDMKEGLYFIRMEYNNQKYSQKLLVKK